MSAISAMASTRPSVAIRARPPAPGRPASDPGCAGCELMGVFRALRRAGLEVRGGAGCDPGAQRSFAPEGGRWAAVGGIATLAGAGARRAAVRARSAGARLLVVADRRRRDATGAAVAAALSRAGVRALSIDGRDLAAAEETVARAEALAPGPAAAPIALVSLARCVRGAPRAPALTVAPSRCNRCGACLGLGCPALSDGGGEAMEIDPAACAGCGACAPLCRSRAIR